MNYTLTDAQQAAVEAVAKAEMRSVKQVVSLLLAEGINWMYMDYGSRYGDVNPKQIEEDLLKEAREF